MSRLVDKLNEVLADEWACVRTLRRAEAMCEEPGKLEVIKRVRKDCSVNCVTLANVIRTLGGRPTDLPSARFTLKLTDESLADVLDLAQSAQDHIVAGLNALLDEPDLKEVRNSLATVVRLQKENRRWLASAISSEER